MCLLMALKIKYPNQIHMLRGNHEDRWINTTFGFQLELNQRANDDPDNPVLFNAFNDCVAFFLVLRTKDIMCWCDRILATSPTNFQVLAYLQA